MGLSGIQIEAIEAYLRLVGLNCPELREEWLDMIQGMDEVWLEFRHAQQAERDRREDASKSGRRR